MDGITLYFIVDLNPLVSRSELRPRLMVRLHARAPRGGVAHTVVVVTGLRYGESCLRDMSALLYMMMLGCPLMKISRSESSSSEAEVFPR
jgi:hypothetical protein